MSSPKNTTMFVFACCACAPPEIASRASSRPTLSFIGVSPLFLEREDPAPIGLHADDDPAVAPRLIQRLVELADLRLAVVHELAPRIVVVDDEHQAGARPCRGHLQHLQVAI